MARLVDHRRTAVDLVFDQDYAIHKEKESHLTTRRFDRNAGFISLADSIPDDLTIVGAVIVTMDDAGNYDTTYIHESLDAVPAPEVTVRFLRASSGSSQSPAVAPMPPPARHRTCA